MGDKTKGLGHEIESPLSMLKPPNSNLKNYVYHLKKRKNPVTLFHNLYICLTIILSIVSCARGVLGEI